MVRHATGRLRLVLSADGDRDAKRDGGRSLKDGAGRDDRVPPALQGAGVSRDLPGPGGRGEGAVNRGADAQVDDEPHDLGGHGDSGGRGGDRVPGDDGRNSREGGGDDADERARREQLIVTFARELADQLGSARTGARSPASALHALAAAYLRFAQSQPAVYDAMFVMPVDLPFAVADTPAAPRSGFAELLTALTPLAAGRDLDTLAEVTWSALHGLATLARSDRLRASHQQARLDLLVEQLTEPAGAQPAD